jgi:hypothetical protein
VPRDFAQNRAERAVERYYTFAAAGRCRRRRESKYLTAGRRANAAPLSRIGFSKLFRILYLLLFAFLNLTFRLSRPFGFTLSFQKKFASVNHRADAKRTRSENFRKISE